MNIYISRRREYEFGVAIGVYADWIDETRTLTIRLSFGRYAIVLAIRLKESKNLW